MLSRAVRLARFAVPAAAAAIVVALAVAALRAERSHRVAAEQVMRDYAGVAATEFIRRTAFDVGFNGYQPVAIALARTAAAGEIRLPPALPASSRALVDHLFVVEGDAARQLAGGPAPSWLLPWIRAEAAHVPPDHDSYFVRHRIVDGAAATLIVVPLDEVGRRVAAFDVSLAAQRPFLQRSLDRGPLLPEVVGDGKLGNDVLSLSYRDHAGAERLRSGSGSWPDWEVDVRFNDFFRSVLEDSHVRVAIDPAVAARLLPGGLPSSQLPVLVVLLAGALLLGGLGLLQTRRERAFARLREDFVVGVSHELRTPLAQIRLFTETVLLGRAASAQEERRFLEGAARETIRLGHLVDNILDFSRAERGVLDLAPAPRRLAPLVDEVTRSFQPVAARRRVVLAAELDPEAGAAVDEAGFTRLLLNLLDNAVKYGPEQGDVTVRLRRADDKVELAVEDRGPGVPPRERAAIFEPFHRLPRDRRSASTGAGIGLAIVRMPHAYRKARERDVREMSGNRQARRGPVR